MRFLRCSTRGAWLNCSLAIALSFFTAINSRAADFVVTNTNSSGLGSLYQAITDANNTPGADRIVFNIPGSGVHKIDVSQTPIPTITESLTIDGYTQPGATPNSFDFGDNAIILIQIDGGTSSLNQPPPYQRSGLIFLRATAANGRGYSPSDYTVRGLSLTGFGGSGVYPPGGIPAGGIALGVFYGQVDSLVILGNFIGLLPDGETPRGSTDGVAGPTRLGGADPADRNVISGNSEGCAIIGADAAIEGNYFGTNASGTKALPNGTAIQADGKLYNTVIGGTGPGSGNLISGNSAGVVLGRYYQAAPRTYPPPLPANGLHIVGNLIGVQADGVTPLPNSSAAITILAGTDNVVGGVDAGSGNVITSNGSGVLIGSSSSGVTAHDQILSNSIYANKGLGIDAVVYRSNYSLGPQGVTPNDAGDQDGIQNFPILNSAVFTNGTVEVTGTLDSTANTSFRVEIFGSDTADPSGYGEGQSYLGFANVLSDANGHGAFDVTLAAPASTRAITSTATGANSTSEFSAALFAKLLNISTRADVQAGDRITIGGFIITGNDTKQVLLRGLGPSLGFPGTLRDPGIELHDTSGNLVALNNNWSDSQQSGIEATGLAPHDFRESALLMSLAPGAYTVELMGADANDTGIGLVEVYDVTQLGAELANISTRGFVDTGDTVMIGGFIVAPNTGRTSRVLLRGIGPSLKNVANSLQDPMLELHDSNGTLLASNDDWKANTSQIQATGIPPTDDRESALVADLIPSSYTVVLRGKNDTRGVALVEIYHLE